VEQTAAVMMMKFIDYDDVYIENAGRDKFLWSKNVSPANNVLSMGAREINELLLACTHFASVSRNCLRQKLRA
jgi:hypothetical protein